MIDMLSLLPQYTPDQFDSRHRLVIVAAQRAKHIVQGSRPFGVSRFTKETTIALDEVLRGEAKYLIGKDARDAMKEAKRGKEGETERMAMMTGEDAKEIKKELSVYVDDSLMKTEGGMGLLWFSTEKFGDCALRVVYRTTTKDDNSGIFIRIPDPPRDP